MHKNDVDVIVIGAGAAGLMAALEIISTGRTVAVIEAKNRCGGRMNTAHTNDGYPAELGAEFVHGNLPVTLGLLKKAAAKTRPVRGRVWQYKHGRLDRQESMMPDEEGLEKKFGELNGDLPVAEFLSTRLTGEKFKELRFTLTNYVEGYYAADATRSSTFALRDELSKDDEEQYRIEGGYQTLVDYLERQCRDGGARFFLSETVRGLQWREKEVEVKTETQIYRAGKALVTVSMGVLAAGGLAFSPALPEKTAAAQRLGFGSVVKIVLEFEDAFWKDENLTGGKNLSDLNFLFSEEIIPTWWTQHPKEKAVLAGWLGGPKAEALKKAGKDGVQQKALAALSRIFNTDVRYLSRKLLSSHFYNWKADPHFCGAYSYEVVGGVGLQKTVLRPVENTVYFAGEGLHHGPEIGTVEAALQSGQSVARNLVARF